MENLKPTLADNTLCSADSQSAECWSEGACQRCAFAVYTETPAEQQTNKEEEKSDN